MHVSGKQVCIVIHGTCLKQPKNEGFRWHDGCNRLWRIGNEGATTEKSINDLKTMRMVTMTKAATTVMIGRTENLHTKSLLSTNMKSTPRVIRVDVFVMAGLLLAGAFLMATAGPKDQKEKAAVTAELKPQTTCPIMGGAIDKELYVDYKGKRIYVCCSGCIDAVKKDPEGAIKKLASMGESVEVLAAVVEPAPAEKTVKLKPQSHCPVMTGNAINRKSFVDYKGKRIYVCCGGCVASVKADPEKYLAVLESIGEQAESIPDPKK